MDTPFWLIVVGNHQVVVSLAQSSNLHHFVKSLGQYFPWDHSRPDSLITAVDQSLASAADGISLPEDDEPSQAAFVLPPTWITSEGKIAPHYLKDIEQVCRGLKLKPLGFIADDEAIIEEANIAEGFPVSFLLLHLEDTEFSLTLSYLGKIKERLSHSLDSGFDPKYLEQAISSLHTDSALPPEIIVYGHVRQSDIEAIKNYSWIGRRDIETFLQFPSVTHLTSTQLIEKYCRIISSQFTPTALNSPVDNIDMTSPDESEATSDTSVSSTPDLPLIEVEPSTLGFATFTSEPTPDHSPQVPISETASPAPPSRLRFPSRFKLPRLHLKTSRLLLLFGLAPLLVLIPALFSTAHLTLHLTPYQFNQKYSVSIDDQTNTFDPAKKIIPVQSQTHQVSQSATIQTSGQVTIGEKSRGEVTIYNQHNSPLNLKKGVVFTDNQNHRYTLTSATQVPASSINFDTGTIAMGQIKANLEAADIGPEFNVVKDVKLQLREPADNLTVAKVNSGLVGGSRSQVRAVSLADKTTLEKELSQKIADSLSSLQDQEPGSDGNILPELTEISQQKINYSREVAEPADQLTATIDGKVVVYLLTQETKIKILENFLASEEGFNQKTLNHHDFSVSYSKGQLTVVGQSLPYVDIQLLQSKLSKRPIWSALGTINQVAPRTYNYQIDRNFSFLGRLNPLPLRPQNITIEVRP